MVDLDFQATQSSHVREIFKTNLIQNKCQQSLVCSWAVSRKFVIRFFDLWI